MSFPLCRISSMPFFFVRFPVLAIAIISANSLQDNVFELQMDPDSWAPLLRLYLLNKHLYSALFIAPSRKGLERT